MPVFVLSLADLPRELRKIPKADEGAVKAAIWRTASLDAHRWIQWAIKGGGWVAPPAKETPKAGPKKVRKRGSRPTVAKKATAPKGAIRKKRKRKTRKCRSPNPPTYRQPVDTGDYKASWRDELFPWGAEVYSSPSPPIKAGVIEMGRRPGTGIPIEPLADWVRRKLGCKDPTQARSIAIAISRTAKRRGRPGLHVLRRAHPKILEALERNLRREIRDQKWRR